MITQSHNLRHLLLQVGPIDWEIRLAILRQPAFRVVNRITAENEQLLDAPVVYIRGQLRHLYGARVIGELSNYQCLAEIFQRSVDPVNEHLHRDWLAWTGQ